MEDEVERRFEGVLFVVVKSFESGGAGSWWISAWRGLGVGKDAKKSIIVAGGVERKE